MKTIINHILNFFSSSDKEDEHLVEIQRNDKCYCDSGKKYKNCHLIKLQKKGKIALYSIDKNGINKRVEILSKRKYKNQSIRFRTNLTGKDIGGGGNLE
ncbi:hypothetical protein GCQ56_14795 [Marinifilum sp. N1E240]|uniref:SEC-C metal-binding domain-containing protein n=1 Tax=Marinifilum sp. N1E240 TaxID=2608082 RepID=UPI00128CD22B|nr:SEC-C metal-binding domain-containing protein [Marinifilum sp. N1E240]MPQ48269.1 hypothetical protein [Marinifilum sp. N1E240]